MPIVTRKELADKIRGAKGFFTVRFQKRTDNQVRQMNCLNHVKKHLTGGGPKYDAASHGLINTFSVQDQGYRSIPVEGLMDATINGEVYVAR